MKMGEELRATTTPYTAQIIPIRMAYNQILVASKYLQIFE